MDQEGVEKAAFRQQRRVGMIAIAVAMPIALLLWLAIAYLTSPLGGWKALAPGCSLR
jgi:hypothetical protein